jgi:hypothetical protein
LNPDGSEDLDLKIQDLPDIVVGDYNQVNSASQPIIIPNNNDTIEVDSLTPQFYYTLRERIKGIKPEEEDENIVTTDSSDEAEEGFDSSDSDVDFDEVMDGDEEEGDCDID